MSVVTGRIGSVARAPRPPRQDRSRQTLDLLARSAEEALRIRTFDEVSLKEIVRGAGVTTGAFYARFSVKDDLLRYLEEEISESLRSSTASRLVESAPSCGDGREFIRGMLSDLAQIYEDHRGVLRALMERSRIDPDLRQRRLSHNREALAVAKAVLAGTAASKVPDFDERFEIGSLFILGSLREVFLHREFFPQQMAPTKTALIDGLVDAFFAYLQCDLGGS